MAPVYQPGTWAKSGMTEGGGVMHARVPDALQRSCAGAQSRDFSVAGHDCAESARPLDANASATGGRRPWKAQTGALVVHLYDGSMRLSDGRGLVWFAVLRGLHVAVADPAREHDGQGKHERDDGYALHRI